MCGLKLCIQAFTLFYRSCLHSIMCKNTVSKANASSIYNIIWRFFLESTIIYYNHVTDISNNGKNKTSFPIFIIIRKRKRKMKMINILELYAILGSVNYQRRWQGRFLQLHCLNHSEALQTVDAPVQSYRSLQL